MRYFSKADQLHQVHNLGILSKLLVKQCVIDVNPKDVFSYLSIVIELLHVNIEVFFRLELLADHFLLPLVEPLHLRIFVLMFLALGSTFRLRIAGDALTVKTIHTVIGVLLLHKTLQSFVSVEYFTLEFIYNSVLSLDTTKLRFNGLTSGCPVFHT